MLRIAGHQSGQIEKQRNLLATHLSLSTTAAAHIVQQAHSNRSQPRQHHNTNGMDGKIIVNAHQQLQRVLLPVGQLEPLPLIGVERDLNDLSEKTRRLITDELVERNLILFEILGELQQEIGPGFVWKNWRENDLRIQKRFNVLPELI